jgi:hypothetical protein
MNSSVGAINLSLFDVFTSRNRTAKRCARSEFRRWLHNAPASNSIQDTEEILLELSTQSRNLCSSAAVSVIQYGIPSLSRRAVSNWCSIQ